MKRISCVLALMLLQACISMSIKDEQYQAFSSGSIGCRPDEITISNQTKTVGPGDIPTWTAACKGEIYRCSAAGDTVQCAKAK